MFRQQYLAGFTVLHCIQKKNRKNFLSNFLSNWSCMSISLVVGRWSLTLWKVFHYIICLLKSCGQQIRYQTICPTKEIYYLGLCPSFPKLKTPSIVSLVTLQWIKVFHINREQCELRICKQNPFQLTILTCSYCYCKALI